MQPHQHRVVTEKTELDDKISRLHLFFGTEVFACLGDAEMNRLQRQAIAMQQYSDILGERVAAFERT